MLDTVTTTRVTISLPEDLARRLHDEAGSGSVSAYVAALIGDHFESADLDALWAEYVDDVGVTPDDIASADALLDALVESAEHA